GNIGLQLYSLKDMATKDLLGTIETVAKIGYDGVELWNNFGIPAAEIRRVLDASGIRCSGSHVGLDELLTHLDRVIETSLTLGGASIVCPRVPEEMRNSSDAFKRTADVFSRIGERCKASGLTFAFHHHGEELGIFDGESGLDIIARFSDPAVVKLQLEVYWLVLGGHDPAAAVEKYSDRCASLHVSDVKSVESRDYTELGRGIVDMPALVAACRRHGVEWLNVEHEWYDKGELQSLVESLGYLRSLE
ncbi:MAG TPA: sugar phosphate isomerase/epimerase family protein, partial [Spirochaetia bacterium]